jgi:hypothetical protein
MPRKAPRRSRRSQSPKKPRGRKRTAAVRTAKRGAQAASSTGGAAAPGALGVAVDHQEQDNWCWAAVAAGVSRFFSQPITQCQVASHTLGDACCNNPHPCDQPWQLDAALDAVGHYRTWAQRTLSLGQIAGEIDDGRPLGARIQWYEGGGHFVVIDGYDAEANVIVVRDPGDGGKHIMDIDEFTTAYRDGAGRWTHTYWVE